MTNAHRFGSMQKDFFGFTSFPLCELEIIKPGIAITLTGFPRYRAFENGESEVCRHLREEGVIVKLGELISHVRFSRDQLNAGGLSDQKTVLGVFPLCHG